VLRMLRHLINALLPVDALHALQLHLLQRKHSAVSCEKRKWTSVSPRSCINMFTQLCCCWRHCRTALPLCWALIVPSQAIGGAQLQQRQARQHAYGVVRPCVIHVYSLFLTALYTVPKEPLEMVSTRSNSSWGCSRCTSIKVCSHVAAYRLQ
jgi:hypothetical protein